MNQEHLFNYDNELVKYTKKEVMNYINRSDESLILYSYNRMTIDEITQEALLKILRFNNGNINKAYVRKAVRCTCIDLYRKVTDIDLSVYAKSESQDMDSESDFNDVSVDELLILSIDEEEAFREVTEGRIVDKYEGKAKEVISLLNEGYSNTEVWNMLEIPHRTYYYLLARIKSELNK